MEEGKQQLEELAKLPLEARIKILDYWVAKFLASLDITPREYARLSSVCMLCNTKLKPT